MDWLRNKKADISVTVLVILALMVSASALFMFVYSNSKINSQISDLQYIQELYAEEESFIFSITLLSEQVVKDNQEVTQEDFVKEFRDLYKRLYAKSEILDKYWSEIAPPSAKYDVKIEDGKLKFRLKDFEFKMENKDFKAKHIKDIYFEIPLKTQTA